MRIPYENIEICDLSLYYMVSQLNMQTGRI